MNSIRRNPFQAESMLRATSAYKSTHHCWRGLEGFQICACAFALNEWFLVFLFLCPCSIAAVSSFAFSHHTACLSQVESLSHCLPAWVASGVLCVLFCVCSTISAWSMAGKWKQLFPVYTELCSSFYIAHWGITFPSTEPPSHGAALWFSSRMCGDRFLCHLHPVWILVLHRRGSKEGKTHFYKFLGFF